EAGSSTPDAVAPAAEQPSTEQEDAAFVAETASDAMSESRPEPEDEPPAPPRDPVLADWLQPGELSGRLHFRHPDGPELWIDADARVDHGPNHLTTPAPPNHGYAQHAALQLVHA